MQQHSGSASLQSMSPVEENEILAEIESVLVEKRSPFGGEGGASPLRRAPGRSRLPLVLAIGVAIIVALVPAGLKKGHLASAVMREATAGD